MRLLTRLAALSLGVLAVLPAAAQIPANLLSLRPIKGVSYQPSPSDDCQLQSQQCTTFNGVYYDTDFYNTDFALLWGPGTATNPGRDDLKTLKDQGVNFLHIYNWNPQRDHGPFLDAVATHGMKLTVPVSNYTACLIVGGCQGVGAGSYLNAYNNIKAIFNQVYGTNNKPHPAAAVWAIYNEYDYNGIDPTNVAFAIQAILKLENDAGIAAADRLPFVVPVSNAVNSGSSQPYFQTAQAIYQAIPNANPSIPAGVVAIIAASVALQNANINNTTSYGGVNVGAMPSTFWGTRFIATVNPFTSGPTINAYITQASQFQSSFPAAVVITTAQTWNAAWNTLPPLFLTEMGINIGGSGPTPSTGTTATQATWVLLQLQCTNPWAVDATSTPQGYFLGSNIFEFEYEGVNGRWGMFVFPSPLVYTTGTTTGGQSYRVDTLNAQLAWASVASGFQATSKTLCTQ